MQTALARMRGARARAAPWPIWPWRPRQISGCYSSPPPEELTSAAGSARLSALLAAGGAHPRSAALARVLRPRAAGGAWPRGRRHSPAAQPSSHARLARSRRRSMAAQLLDATRGSCTRAAGRAASHAGGVSLRTTRRGRRCWLAPRRAALAAASAGVQARGASPQSFFHAAAPLHTAGARPHGGGCRGTRFHRA